MIYEMILDSSLNSESTSQQECMGVMGCKKNCVFKLIGGRNGELLKLSETTRESKSVHESEWQNKLRV